MKKIIFALFIAFIAISCDRDMEFETKTVTEPSLTVQVEGVPANNVYPKIQGASVDLFNSVNQLLATGVTDAAGRVTFTKSQLKEKGKFKVVATKGTLVGEKTTEYILLNDGETLVIVTIQEPKKD